MKKETQYIHQVNKNIEANENLGIEKIKTTNVNILLNRVRLDQKRNQRKKIFFSLFLIISICTLAFYFSI